MKKDPFVDVIMTNYNKGQYIEEAISSVVNQEFKNWNLIIIDNFSQDNSKKILDKFRTSIHNVNIIKSGYISVFSRSKNHRAPERSK